MATARPKQARRRAGAASGTRPRSAAASSKPRQKAPASRHRRELGAIACLAIAVFLGFVLYLGWDGGSLGRWLGDVARWLVGILAFALPFLLGFLAYLLVVKEESRPRRGMSWGVAFIVAGVALAAAADAFGIFSGVRPDALFRDTYMSAHGGVLGEIQWAVLSPFIGRRRRRRARRRTHRRRHPARDRLVAAPVGVALKAGRRQSGQGRAQPGGVARRTPPGRKRDPRRGALRVADHRRRRPHAHLHHAGGDTGPRLLAPAARGRTAPHRRRLRGAGDLRRTGAGTGRAGSRADRGGRRRGAAFARRRRRCRGRERRGERRGRRARLRRGREAAVVLAGPGGPAPPRPGQR